MVQQKEIEPTEEEEEEGKRKKKPRNEIKTPLKHYRRYKTGYFIDGIHRQSNTNSRFNCISNAYYTPAPFAVPKSINASRANQRYEN